MFRNGLRNFSRLSSLVICFELCFAPLALAQVNQTQSKSQNFASTVQQVANLGLSAINGLQQNQAGPNNSYQAFVSQFTPALQMTPINPQEIPAVFQGCIVLPASGATLTGQYSCEQADPSVIAQGFGNAIISIAEKNLVDLENFQTRGHARYSTQGIGCYEKKLQDYQATMDAREEELKKFSTNLKNKIENLTIAINDGSGNKNIPVDQYLDLIKTDEALLTGSPSRFIKDTRFEDYLVGQNDQVCNTFLSKSDIDQVASQGLRGIQEDVFARVNNNSNGNLTADEMLAKATDIETEVKTYGRELGKLAQRKDGLSLDIDDVTYSSRLSGTISASLERVAGQFNSKMSEELDTLEQESNVDQAVSGSQEAQAILTGIKSGNINFQERLSSYERSMKAQCLNQSITNSFGSIQTFATSFRDPNVSKRISREADNSLANLIISEFNQDGSDLDIEEITRTIASHEETGSHSRKVFRSDNTFAVDGKVYGGLPMRASQLLGIFKDNCIASFKRTRNTDGFAGQDIVTKIREYGNRYNTLKSQAPNAIKTLLQDEIVNCSHDTTTGSGALSCNDALQASNPSFCVRTAKTCASNMNGCLEKSRSVVKQIADKQQNKVDFLNVSTSNLKNTIKAELEILTQFYESQARSIDGQLDIGTIFKMPEDMAFNLNADFSFQGEEGQDLPSEFNLEDPKAMMDHALEKVDNLRVALENHNREVAGKLDEIKNDYISNYQRQADHWNNIIQQCTARNNAYQQEAQQAETARLEKQAEIDRGCAEIRAFNASNSCDDVGDLAGTVQEISLIASQQSGNPNYVNETAAYETLGQIDAYCGRLEKRNLQNKRNPSSEVFASYCEENSGNEDCRDLQKYSKTCPDNKSFIETARKKLAANHLSDDGRVCISSLAGKLKIEKWRDGCENDMIFTEALEQKDITDQLIGNSLLAGCQDREYIHSSYTKAKNRLIREMSDSDYTADLNFKSSSSHGENRQEVSVAACNAQGNGVVGKDGFLNIATQAAQDIFRSTAGANRESINNTVPSNGN